MVRSSDEQREIERHKYFLSEKRGYDVGWEVAEQDWERQYGEAWRRTHGRSERNNASDSRSAVVRYDPLESPGLDRKPGPLRRLFARLFS
jgi:hypothetical protein